MNKDVSGSRRQLRASKREGLRSSSCPLRKGRGGSVRNTEIGIKKGINSVNIQQQRRGCPPPAACCRVRGLGKFVIQDAAAGAKTAPAACENLG